MKRAAIERPEQEHPPAKRARPISTKYPGLRAPPRPRKLMPKPWSGAVKIGSSPLERLPPEIRNLIYELVLVEKNSALEVRHQHYFDRDTTLHSLTQVSRFVRQECLQMYLSNNTFKFSSLLDMELWLMTIEPDCRYVKKVELGDGVIEGRHYPSPIQPLRGKPRTRTEFIYRITKGKSRFFDTNYPIHPWTRFSALEKLQPFGRAMVERVETELVIEGTVAHCPMCAQGQQWSCGMESWWEEA